jgi:PX domain
MEPPPPHRPDSNSTSDGGAGPEHVSQNATPPATISPPYWQRHDRTASSVSIDTRPPPISLEDHDNGLSPSHSALWAKAVSIDDYTVVRGSLSPAVGAYVVWNVNVLTLDGGPMKIRKRYSEFDKLRIQLIAAFPNATTSSLPLLPPKSVIYKFRAKFLERRRAGLQYFLNCVMLNPEYSGSPIVRDFIFAHEE